MSLAATIQIDGLNAVTVPNVPPLFLGVPAITIVPFAAIQHVGGMNWDISVGQLIVVIVPGPNNTTVFASVTLTGVNGNPLTFTFNPGGQAGGNGVSVTFSSGNFDPIKPAIDSASLDGTYSRPAVPLAVGPTLVARTNGQMFGVIGPLAVPVNGAFAGAIGPIADVNLLGVSNVSGLFSFTFAANQMAGDTVNLPNSATVESAMPEPGAGWLIAAGFAVLAWRSRKMTHKEGV